MRSRQALRSAGVAAVAALACVAAHAETIFDSFTVPAGSITGAHNYDQCYTCPSPVPSMVELGDIITFGGSDRAVTSVTVAMNQAKTTAGITPYDLTMQMTLYTVNQTTLQVSPIASSSVDVRLLGEGIFSLPFAFNNVVVPNTIYYGLSFSSTSPFVDNLRFSLWDYWATSAGGDGQVLPVGSDPGTVVGGARNVATIVYGRLAANPLLLQQVVGGGPGISGGANLTQGFTPAVRVVAAPVPEAGTAAMLAAGLLGVAGVAARRRRAR
jgi:hypothetical protein